MIDSTEITRVSSFTWPDPIDSDSGSDISPEDIAELEQALFEEMNNVKTTEKLERCQKLILTSPECEGLSFEGFTGTYLKADPKYHLQTTIFSANEGNASASPPSLPLDELEVTERVNKFVSLGIPEDFRQNLTHLFLLIIKNKEIVYSNPEIKYPACFSGGFYTTNPGNTKDITKFMLEVFPQQNEIRLVFKNLRRFLVFAESLNIIRQAFSLLDQRRIIHRTPNKVRITHNDKKQESIIRTNFVGLCTTRENIFLPLVQGDDRFVRVFNMTQFERPTPKPGKDNSPYHVTTMKEYSSDLITLLINLLRKKIVLPDALKVQLAKQVMNILKGLLEKGIVHRDIKGDNFLLDSECIGKGLNFDTAEEAVAYVEKAKLVLTDFGFSCPIGTMDESLGGTASYRDLIFLMQSLNLEINKIPRINSNDIFSAGIVLWNILYDGVTPDWCDELADHYNQTKILNAIELYSLCMSKLTLSHTSTGNLFANILNPSIENRWTPAQILDGLDQLKFSDSETIMDQLNKIITTEFVLPQ